MKELMDTEQVQVEDRALRYIAKVADGSMRDALSLLDQCIAFHLGKELTYDMTLDVLGQWIRKCSAGCCASSWTGMC